MFRRDIIDRVLGLARCDLAAIDSGCSEIFAIQGVDSTQHVLAVKDYASEGTLGRAELRRWSGDGNTHWSW